MICPNCGSNNVTTQVVSEIKEVKKKKSVLWWILISWWWIPIKWLVFTGYAIILKVIKLLKPKKYKSEARVIHVCQNCGNIWESSER